MLKNLRISTKLYTVLILLVAVTSLQTLINEEIPFETHAFARFLRIA